MRDLKLYSKIFLLTDEQVAKCCLPVVLSKVACELHLPQMADAPTLVLPAGEQHKNLASVQQIWDFLFAHQATRSDLLINIGGGVICDMGGFAASTYMRGMAYANIPTTLLAMVDAATGGKTGIDYTPSPHSPSSSLSPFTLKNAIGVFAEPVATIIRPELLSTLPSEQLLSGWAEMLKHALLQGREPFAELIDFDMQQITSPAFGELIKQSIAFKQSVTQQDPHDKGLRQILNLGHTVGHAIEALLIERSQQSNIPHPTSPKPHGYCVMYGLVAEAYLSHAICGLPAEVVSALSRMMCQYYGAAPISCKDFDPLVQHMLHDKKNTQQGCITCTLLADIGRPLTAQAVTIAQLREALEYLCSL